MQTRRGARTMWNTAVLAALVLCGCSSDMVGKRAGAACTRSSQCVDGLSCDRGSCRSPLSDAGTTPDASDDDAGDVTDGGK